MLCRMLKTQELLIPGRVDQHFVTRTSKNQFVWSSNGYVTLNSTEKRFFYGLLSSTE